MAQSRVWNETGMIQVEDPTGGRKILVEHLAKSYETERGELLPVLLDLNVEIFEHEFVSIIGPSGCGKTTFLNIVAGLIPPTSGRILVDGKEVSRPGRERGMVFQQDAIFMWRTVVGNVEYGLELQKVPKKERRRIAMDNIRIVGLEKFADWYPKELSGGMRKRVAIAMVFANNPEALLMDEPFGSLDYPTKVGLQKELLRIWARERKTTLFVTHDIEEALFLSDRILVLVKGVVAQDISVPMSRPRTDEMRLSREFVDLRNQLWNYF
jgi:NitT/TauT family transport system ATP-binding protein